MSKDGVKDGVKSYKVGKGKPPVEQGRATQFSKTRQPDPKSISAGMKRRSTLMSFLEKVTEFMELSVGEFEQLEKDMLKNKNDYKVSDMIAYRYAQQVTEGKLLKEWSDKNISNATTKVNLKVTSFKEFMEGIEEPK